MEIDDWNQQDLKYYQYFIKVFLTLSTLEFSF